MEKSIDWDAYERVQRKLMHAEGFVDVERYENALNDLLTGRSRSSRGHRLAENVSGSGRKKALTRLAHRAPVVDAPSEAPAPDAQYEANRLASSVASALAAEEVSSSAVVLQLLKGSGYEEVAEELGVTDRQVRNIARQFGSRLRRNPEVDVAVSVLRHDFPRELVALMQTTLDEVAREAA